jgi:DNA-directed RNA polymerase specialized sigma24 family protein
VQPGFVALACIAQNIGTDHLRARREHLPIDAALEVRAEGSPDQDAERHSDLARLALLCGALPTRERELAALKYGAVINNRLIAELTGLTPVNVKALSEACSPGSRFLFAALLAALSVCGVVGEFEFFQ